MDRLNGEQDLITYLCLSAQSTQDDDPKDKVHKTQEVKNEKIRIFN